jgi:hypothetical protein
MPGLAPGFSFGVLRPSQPVGLVLVGGFSFGRGKPPQRGTISVSAVTATNLAPSETIAPAPPAGRRQGTIYALWSMHHFARSAAVILTPGPSTEVTA